MAKPRHSVVITGKEEEAEVQVFIDVCTTPWHTNIVASGLKCLEAFLTDPEIFEKNYFFF